MITVNANLYTIDQPTRDRVTVLEEAVKRLQAQEQVQMKLTEELQTRFARYEAGLAEVAKDMKELRDKIDGADFVSADEKASILASFDGSNQKLDDLGKDPENPVPAVVDAPQV